jgi:deoxyribodipyrimidine photo-lyase
MRGLAAESVPEIRIRSGNERPHAPEGGHVVYWMTAARRREANFALQRSVELATRWGRPLVVLEALRVDYPWASDRLHTFVVEGMAANATAFEDAPVCYYPYVEPVPGAGRGLLRALARDACAVVTDDFPGFFLPRMAEAAGAKIECRLELVDGNGLLPLRATNRVFTTAHSFRRFLHKELPPHLFELPLPDPLRYLELPRAEISPAITRRWPPTPVADLKNVSKLVASLPVDHSVPPGVFRGGAAEGATRLRLFLSEGLLAYGRDRNQPDRDASSGLSPYLHFGHVGAHQVFRSLVEAEEWSPDSLLGLRPTGSREGWWGMSQDAEAFLDQVVTWRELGYNRAALSRDHDSYRDQPEWAQRTLDEHRGDPRAPLYTLEELQEARTHDDVWNAAQRQLVEEGRVHNYLRMLWGKKILEWSESPEQAAERMIELNNRYALDGRNPNSYSGIFWVLGRYDRAWGPERPVFGKIRYMASENTRRKLKMKAYLEKFGEPSELEESRTRG